MRQDACLILVTIFLLVLPVAYAAYHPIEILTVEINGIEAKEDTTIYAERGETLRFHIETRSNETIDDVIVKASISGYEHGTLDTESEIFDMEAGDIHGTSLELKLPADMNTDDKYTLRIEASNDNERSELFETSLRIKPERHQLKIEEVIISPSSVVEAGERLFANIWVANLGAKKEENIDVMVRIPKLGLSAVRVIPDLVPDDEESPDWPDSAETGTIMFSIPREAPSGDYEMSIDVYYNDDHSTVSEKRIVHIENLVEESEPGDRNEVISIASNIPVLYSGGPETKFRMAITNLDAKERSYSVQLIGTQLWADAWAEPAFVTVQPGETKSIVGFLKAFEETEAGSNIFTVKVTSGDSIIEEKELNIEVKPKQENVNKIGDFLNSEGLTGMFIGKKAEDGSSGLGTKLKVSLMILLGIMVVSGAFLGYRKLKEGDDDEFPLEPKKTYY